MGLKQIILDKAHAKSRSSSALKSYSTPSSSASSTQAYDGPSPDSYEAFLLEAERDEAWRLEMERRAKKEVVRKDTWNGGMGAGSDSGVGGMTPKKDMRDADRGTKAWLSGNGLTRQ